MKYRSEFKHGFTNRGCLHCAIILKPYTVFRKREPTSHMQFFLPNIQNEIFKIFKMLKSNMKFTRAACWINSKNKQQRKTTTLIIFLFYHYCWSLLWCNYWKSLKSDSHLPKTIALLGSMKKMMKNAFYFIFKTLFVLKIFKFLCWLFGHVEKTAWLER